MGINRGPEPRPYIHPKVKHQSGTISLNDWLKIEETKGKRTYCCGCRWCINDLAFSKHAGVALKSITAECAANPIYNADLPYDVEVTYEAISVANKDNSCKKYEKAPWWMFWRG